MHFGGSFFEKGDLPVGVLGGVGVFTVAPVGVSVFAVVPIGVFAGCAVGVSDVGAGGAAALGAAVAGGSGVGSFGASTTAVGGGSTFASLETGGSGKAIVGVGVGPVVSGVFPGCFIAKKTTSPRAATTPAPTRPNNAGLLRRRRRPVVVAGSSGIVCSIRPCAMDCDIATDVVADGSERFGAGTSGVMSIFVPPDASRSDKSGMGIFVDDFRCSSRARCMALKSCIGEATGAPGINSCVPVPAFPASADGSFTVGGRGNVARAFFGAMRKVLSVSLESITWV